MCEHFPMFESFCDPLRQKRRNCISPQMETPAMIHSFPDKLLSGTHVFHEVRFSDRFEQSPTVIKQPYAQFRVWRIGMEMSHTKRENSSHGVEAIPKSNSQLASPPKNCAGTPMRSPNVLRCNTSHLINSQPGVISFGSFRSTQMH